MRGRTAAFAAATIPLSAALTVVASLAAIVLFQLVVGFGIVLAFVLGPVIYAAARATWGRRPRAEPEGVACSSLQGLAGEEAAAHGLPAPEARVDAGREIRIAAGALVIGAAALAERPPEVLRAAIGEALLRDADPAARRLVRLYRGPVTRALSVAEELPALSLPWAAHARLAQRLIHAALRERAVAIDAVLAARHGTAAMERHIRALAREDAFGWYWSGWVVPCLQAGFHPPIAEGWRRWLATPASAEAFAGAVGALDAADRLAAVAGHPTGSAAGAPAADLDALEATALAARDPEARLVRIGWDRVADAVVLPELRAAAGTFPGATVADAAGLVEPGDDTIAAALAVTLADHGWHLELRFAEGLCLRRDGVELWPYSFAAAVTQGRLTTAEWRAFAEDAGIAELPLGPAGPPDDGLAALPVAGSATVALRTSRARRRRTLAIVAVVLALALPLSATTLVAAASPGWEPGARAFLYGMAAALAGGAGLWAWLRLRIVLSRGTLSIGPDVVRITHPGHLRHPYELPRSLLRAAVAETAPGLDEQGRSVRFPVGSAWEGVGGWLWVGGHGYVPMLGAPGDQPSLALVLHEAVAGPDVRHAHAHGPQRGEGIAGLLLCADDAEEAARALARLGFRPGPLAYADAEPLVAALGLTPVASA